MSVGSRCTTEGTAIGLRSTSKMLERNREKGIYMSRIGPNFKLKVVSILVALVASVYVPLCLAQVGEAGSGSNFSGDEFSGGVIDQTSGQVTGTFGEVRPDSKTGAFGDGLGGPASDIGRLMDEAHKKQDAAEKAKKDEQDKADAENAGDDQAGDPAATKLIAELMGNSKEGIRSANRANNNMVKAAGSSSGNGNGGAGSGDFSSNVQGELKDPDDIPDFARGDTSDVAADAVDTGGDETGAFNPVTRPRLASSDIRSF